MVTRRGALIVLLVSIAAVSCGDDEGPGAVFTTPTTEATAADSTRGDDVEPYPIRIVEEYLGGCVGEASEKQCRCTIEEFQQRLPLDEFLDLIDTDLDPDPVVGEIIEVCLIRAEDDGEFAAATDLETITELTITDLEQWWMLELPAVFGTEYETVARYGPYFPSQGDIPRCGEPLSRDEFVENAFYCSIDDSVQWDAEGLMAPLFEEFGDFTVALVLAHEWGHAVQARYGFDDISQPTIVSELQADCLAGSWTGRIHREESDLLRLETGDLEEGMAGFLLIGDQLGTNPAGFNAHGGSFDRLNAFFEGFNGGTIECSRYETDPPDVVFIPLRIGEDPIEGGDLPYAETAPLLAAALESFWEIAYPQVFGSPWTAVKRQIPYLPSSGAFPACGGVTLDSSFYESNAFYCPDDDFIAWDDEVLFPSLYREIGDFAIGLVLANEWGRAVQRRAGLPLDTDAAQLQVDCLTGVWTAALIPIDNPTGILLSAGDLEEGIASFLQLTAATEESISAFDRFESFKDGFFEGTAACSL